MDVAYDWQRLRTPKSLSAFEEKWSQRADPHCASGVWRFHELLPFMPLEHCVTVGEGQTLLAESAAVADYVGVRPGRLHLQYEGFNPSGSFKDNGMAAAFSHARLVGASRAACASTGNTSASLALYCAVTRLMKAIIFVGSGKIASGKLSQALDYGALTVQIGGDFDDAMARVQEVAKQLGIYLVNSVNPFRLEGQKTIMYRVLEGLRWQVPDWIVAPGGNLGNSSAFGKAFYELHQLGLIDRIPRLAVINAAGANTLYRLVHDRGLRWNGGAVAQRRSTGSTPTWKQSIAALPPSPAPLKSTARSICRSACGRWSGAKAWSAQVSDEEILDAKAQVGAGGLGCEPASAASVAGAKRLRSEGVIEPDQRVVCILTGHQLKDPDATVAYHSADRQRFEQVLGSRGVRRAAFANRPIVVANDLDAIIKAITTTSVQTQPPGRSPGAFPIPGP